MSIIYNTETAVPQNVKIQQQEVQTIDVMPVVYWSASSGTATVTDDFICTGVYFSATAGDIGFPSLGSMTVSFGDIDLNGCNADTNNITGVPVAVSSFCPLPNWLIRKGTIITFTLQSLANGAAQASVVGYLL